MKKTRSVGAFTLVEVAASLGIFAFCVIGILGLMPVALDSFRASMDLSIKTRIIQTLRARLVDLPYSTLPATKAYAFDEEGVDVDESAYPSRYQVAAKIVKLTALPGASLTSVATVKIEITNEVTQAVISDHFHLPDNGF